MTSSASNPARELADRLNAGQAKTRLAGANYMALCPAHADSDPSLAIRWNGRKLLFRCHTGCQFTEIARALRGQGYDPEDGSVLAARTKAQRPVATAVEDEGDGAVYETWEGWFEAASAKAFEEVPQAVRRHVYRDYDGKPLMRVETSLIPVSGKKPKKRFHPTTPQVMPDGSKVIKEIASPVPRPPYNAEFLGNAGPVVYVEGEKCADALRAFVKSAVPVIAVYGNNPMGTDFAKLKGRPLVAYKDFDASGDGHVYKVAQHHEGPTGIATAPWSGEGPVPEGWDIADAIAGIGGARPLRYREMLEGLRDCANDQEIRGSALYQTAADPAIAVLVTDAAIYRAIVDDAPESAAVANVDVLDAGDDGGEKVIAALPSSSRIVVLHGESRSQRIIALRLVKGHQNALAVMGQRESVSSWQGLIDAVKADAQADADGAAATRTLIRALRQANPKMRDD